MPLLTIPYRGTPVDIITRLNVLEATLEATPGFVSFNPGPAQDVTQGFVPGEVVVNFANGTQWVNVSNATNAAVWLQIAGFSGAIPITTSVTNGITAFSGGGQVGAIPLTSRINRITTVAAGNDSVKLPVSVPGMAVVVINAAAANSANVFPAGGETINALAANAAFALAANKTVEAFCAVAGTWNTLLTA